MTSMWMDDSKVRGLEEIVGHPRLPLCCSICQTKVNRHCCQALEKLKDYYMYTLLIKSLGSLASTSNIIELTHLSIEHIQIESIFNRLQNQQTLLFSLTGKITTG